MYIYTEQRNIMQIFHSGYYLEPSTVEKFVEFRNICNINARLQQQEFTDHQVHMIFCSANITNKKQI